MSKVRSTSPLVTTSWPSGPNRARASRASSSSGSGIPTRRKVRVSHLIHNSGWSDGALEHGRWDVTPASALPAEVCAYLFG
jgi:hypothetical protein